MNDSNIKNLYVAVANNLSRIKAYEYAEENGFEIVGQSAYVSDAAIEICHSNVDTVICSPMLFDGEAKQLYKQLPEHIKDKCNFVIISPIINGVYKLKTPTFSKLYQRNNIIESTLEYINIPKSSKGYVLFKDALNIILSDPDALSSITRKVYGSIAKARNTNAKNVEHNMRAAKDRSLLYAKLDVINEVFGEFPDGKNPSLSVYLSKLSYYILHKK